MHTKASAIIIVGKRTEPELESVEGSLVGLEVVEGVTEPVGVFVGVGVVVGVADGLGEGVAVIVHVKMKAPAEASCEHAALVIVWQVPCP